MKRVVDLFVSAAGLVVLSPVIAAIALAVRLADGTPVLFLQERAGLHGQPFEVKKFRTMAPGSEDPETDEDRITRLGSWLRSTSLDELPSLVNVFRGDMSLVGPRPLPMRYLDRYSPAQARRHEVRPGITGLAQVSGRNGISWEERFELDIDYVDSQSLRGDVTILVATVRSVVNRDGISAEGHATMPEFEGSSS